MAELMPLADSTLSLSLSLERPNDRTTERSSLSLVWFIGLARVETEGTGKNDVLVT